MPVHLIEQMPIWLVGIVILASLIGAQQLGFLGGRLLTRKGEGKGLEGIGYLLSAALALLGLLIAFTFATAADRYNTRRNLLMDEANAIRTTYVRVQALDEGPKAALSPLVADYAKVRRASVAAAEDRPATARIDGETERLQEAIWGETVKAARTATVPTLNGPLLEAVNRAFDLAASRRAALDARIPITILRTLVIFALVSALIIGIALGGGTRYLLASGALFVVLSLAACLILDLDRPHTGTITISEAPMVRMLATIQRLEAARIAAAPPAPAGAR
jgi:hypothetical protein